MRGSSTILAAFVHGDFMRKFILSLFAMLAFLLLCAATQSPQRIVIIGDSTVCNYASSAYPWAGWGQEIALYFNTGTVSVTNKAIGGRSSRSFYTDGHWASTLSALQSGDILMIQFGHNDRSTDTSRYTDTLNYKMYLSKYITEARARGVHPILVTPMNMNTWTGTTVREVFCEGANNYRIAMIHVGDSLKVPVLDLEKKSKLLMDTMGQAYMTKFHFMGLDTGEYPNYPTGNVDGTHFQEVGSLENARMIVEEIGRQSTDSILKLLAPNIAPLYPVNITTNKAGAGTITKTRRFPLGATVTMKVKSASASNVFAYWADSTGKSATTATRFTYVQVARATTWQAVWQGTPPLSSSSIAVSSSSVAASSSAAASSSSKVSSSSIQVVSSSSLIALSSSSVLNQSSSTVSSSSSAVTTSLITIHGGILSSRGHMQVFDLQGHKVRESIGDADCRQLPRGLYIVRIVP